MSDLQTKYQKLAAEYSKLRAQVPVLKKALLDEQTLHDDLKDNIKEKDQAVRKYEQEVESLSFRNTQLSTRVSILQHELDDMEKKGKKSKKSPNHLPTNSPSRPEFASQASVIGEELQNKIEENANLHKELYEAETVNRQIISELEDKLSVLQHENSRHQEVVNSAAQQSRSQLEKLQEEKAFLEVRLQKQESECRDAKQTVTEVKSQLNDMQHNLTQKLEHAENTILNKLPFNDCESSQLNALNIPSHDRRQQLQTRELVNQAAGLLKELLDALSNFYTYTEQRTKAYPVNVETDMISDTNKKYCSLLRDNVQYLRPMEYAFRTFQESLKDDILVTLEIASGLSDFATNWKKFVSYATKLLPYQLMSLEEECSVSSCTGTLETKNRELITALKLFTGSLEKVDTYISIITLQSSTVCDHPKSNHGKMFELFAKSLQDFQESSKEMFKFYSAKVSLEHQLPTVTQKLKVTNECIITSLVSLVTSSSKISAFLSGNLQFLQKCVDVSSSGPKSDKVPPVVNSYRQKAVDYMSALSESPHESVPHRLAVQNRHTLLSSTESRDSLAQKVTSYQERISRLEQDKEHWMLELQLAQMKLEKEQMKNTDLEKKLEGSIEDNLEKVRPEPVGAAVTRQNSQPVHIDTSMLGSVETSGQGDWESRETLIRQHFTNRITELTKELQTADTMAVYFQAECRSLTKQLAMRRAQCDEIQENLATSSQMTAQLRDELHTTSKSYEGQLNMMTEHLAAMNDKLAAQRDTIDMLQYKLKNDKSK